MGVGVGVAVGVSSRVGVEARVGTGVNRVIRVGTGSDVTVGAGVAVGVGVSTGKGVGIGVGIGVAVGVAPPQPRILTRRNNMVMKTPGLKGRRNTYPPFRLRSGHALALPQRHSLLQILTMTP